MHNVYWICDKNDMILDEYTNKAKAVAHLKDMVRKHREYGIASLAVYETAYISQGRE